MNQSPTSDEITDSYRMIIIKEFGADWVKLSSPHPVRDILKRRDLTAQGEIRVLGAALSRISKENRTWATNVVKEAKKDDLGNARGSLFELIFASYNITQGQKVTLYPKNHKVYDMNVEFEGGQSARVSFKCFGSSMAEKRFQSESRRVELRLEKLTESLGLNYHCLYIQSNSCPEQEDWNIICEGLLGIIIEYISLINFTTDKELLKNIGIWSVRFCRMPDAGFPICRDFHSYKLLISSPRFRSDDSNIITKLSEGCTSIRNSHFREDHGVSNSLVVRVSATSNIRDAMEWCDQYIAENPEGKVHRILLYQEGRCEDGDGRRHYMCHVALSFETLFYKEWKARLPNGWLTTFQGSAASETPFVDEIAIGSDKIDATNRYLFQSGRIFFDCSLKEGIAIYATGFGSGVDIYFVEPANGSTEKTMGAYAIQRQTVLLE